MKMRTIAWALAALGLVCLPALPASAAAYVLGDSLGLGVARAAKIKNLSKLSVHIRGRKALEQFSQTPPGSTVFLSLGTNDAVGSIAKLDRSIDAIVSIAERKKITLVWLGPPCVQLNWDTRARELDALLTEKLAGTSVRYVSMRDERLCSGELHERDGVHLKAKGYAHMWEKARAVTGYEVASADPAQPIITSSVPRPPVRNSRSVRKNQQIPLPIPRPPRP